MNLRRYRSMLHVLTIWLAIILFLIFSLLYLEKISDVIYYTGYVRGATQKLIRAELVGLSNPQLETGLDGILSELRTGEGGHEVILLTDQQYQLCLFEMEQMWQDIRKEIRTIRETGESKNLYRLGDEYFDVCNRAYMAAQDCLNRCLTLTIALVVALAAVAAVYLFFAERRRRLECEQVFYTDNLTGIDNKEAFSVRAGALLKRNPKQRYALVHFDLNNFKYINEVHGHEKGDELLRSVALAVSESGREGETCARLYSDHFVLLAKYEETLLDELQNRILQGTRKRMDLDFSVPLSFSFGIYVILDNQESIGTAVDKAEFSNREAKNQKKTDIVFYDEQVRRQVQRENFFEGKMQSALEQGEFQVYLQPKFQIFSGEMIGAEALVRWISPELGIVSPGDFIPLFERNGFIIRLDYYILEEVCRRLRRQLEQGSGGVVPLAVNFSRVSVYRKDFVKDFLSVVERYQIPSRYIEVEITETVLGINPDGMLQIMEQLQEKGFLIAMDDFGTGYSSLNFLRSLPVDVIKLDRDFLAEGYEGNRTCQIIRCVVELGKVLGAQIVCEGVETEEQLVFLKKIGCDIAQGFYFEKPMPVEEFDEKYAPHLFEPGTAQRPDHLLL